MLTKRMIETIKEEIKNLEKRIAQEQQSMREDEEILKIWENDEVALTGIMESKLEIQRLKEFKNKLKLKLA